MPKLTLPVRSFVEFVLRSGDLLSGFSDRNRMADGVRAHKRLQKMRGTAYAAETPISYREKRDDLEIEIVGRIDGLIVTPDRILVEEIKTITHAFDQDRPDRAKHWAQAKVYAFIIGHQLSVASVDVQLTYVRLDPWETHEDCRSFSLAELRQTFDDLLTRYLEWTRPVIDWIARRDASIATLGFPFPAYRKGQRRISVAAYRTIESRGRLFIQAPTGIGKTVSVLFPAIKALREGHAEKLFYLTAKTIGRTVAEKTLEDLRGGGLAIKSVTLTAKDKVCFKREEDRSCDQTQCPYAIGYFDRINDALKDTFVRYDNLNRDVIEAQAQRHRVCPFELSLDLSLWADVVICDYNYVFDPRAYLRRFFMDQTGGPYLFLVDEAHNLVDRAREMFSASLSKRDCLELRRAVKPYSAELAKRLSAINDALLLYRKRCEEEEDYGRLVAADLPEEMIAPLQQFAGLMEQLLVSGPYLPLRDALLDYYFEVLAFLRVADLFDERYVTYAEKFGQDVTLRLFCIDPSYLIRQALNRGSAVLFFSATLLPLPYFRNLLGGDSTDPMLSLSSPFPPERLHTLLADQIGTSYKLRDQSYDAVAAAIAGVVKARTGGYLIFFPSYRYLASVYERFYLTHPTLRVQLQEPSMTERERDAFLQRFGADPGETLVGFVVMGGIFGEGIDLVGDRLIGAVVVGVGLPQVCLERELIRGHFADRGVDGFDYAYVYPGVNRVLQAVGRVIRTEEDCGVALLIDQRFSETHYRDLLPDWWQPLLSVRDAGHVEAEARAFWETMEAEG